MKHSPLSSVLTTILIVLLTANNILTKFSERYAPFCIEVNPDKSELTYERFFPILDLINDTNQFVPVSNSTKDCDAPDTPHCGTGSRRFIDRIEFSRINVTDEEQGVDHNHPINPLRQWAHIKVVAKGLKTLEGLFMQVIAGPAGVPKGQFRTDFHCGDCPDYNKKLDISPVSCKFRPGSSIIHPGVIFIGGSKTKSITRFHEAHFHYNWVDQYWDELAYFQILVIAVKNFDRLIYDVYYTRIKTQLNPDSAVGFPYPVYGGWNSKNMKCHLKKQEPFNFKTLKYDLYKNKFFKIRYNKDYDNCIVNGTLLTERVCGPGAFTQEEHTLDLPQWKSRRQEYVKVDNIDKTICKTCGNFTETQDPCDEVPPPNLESCKDWEPPKPEPDGDGDGPDENSTPGKKALKWSAEVGIKLHGLGFIFCWSLPMNMLIFYARFMKEAKELRKENVILGLGSWLVSHIFLAYLSILGLATGAFLMYRNTIEYCFVYTHADEGTKRDKCEDKAHGHAIVGNFAMLLLFVSYLSSWWRPDAPFCRSLVILVHVVTAYASKYLALLSLIPTHAPQNIVICWIVAEVLCVIVFILATIVQCISDTRMGLSPKRSWFPVLEGIYTFPAAPCSGIRTLLLIIHWVLQTTLFAVICIVYFL